MKYSELFKNAILNLYKNKVYTVDFAILKATEYVDKNKLTAEDYEEMMTYFATEQEKEMTVEEKVINDTEETTEEG